MRTFPKMIFGACDIFSQSVKDLEKNKWLLFSKGENICYYKRNIVIEKYRAFNHIHLSIVKKNRYIFFKCRIMWYKYITLRATSGLKRGSLNPVVLIFNTFYDRVYENPWYKYFRYPLINFGCSLVGCLLSCVEMPMILTPSFCSSHSPLFFFYILKISLFPLTLSKFPYYTTYLVHLSIILYTYISKLHLNLESRQIKILTHNNC